MLVTVLLVRLLAFLHFCLGFHQNLKVFHIRKYKLQIYFLGIKKPRVGEGTNPSPLLKAEKHMKRRNERGLMDWETERPPGRA